MSTPPFYAGKKVFVTGHTGFKGAWLCMWLHALGAKMEAALAQLMIDEHDIGGDVLHYQDMKFLSHVRRDPA